MNDEMKALARGIVEGRCWESRADTTGSQGQLQNVRERRGE